MEHPEPYPTKGHIRARIGSLRTVHTKGDNGVDAKTERRFELLPLFPDQFLYVVDHTTQEVIYAKGFEVVLGYRDAAMDLESIIGLWHPDDAPAMARITKVAFQTMAEVRPPLRPFETSLLVDYRARRANGEYVKILRQTSVFEMDPHTRGPRITLSICQDISRIKSSRTICWQCTGRGAEIFDRRLIGEELPGLLSRPTKREMEIIIKLVNGSCSKRIARDLGITWNTVNTHRRNILERAGLKNTAELVRLAVEQGWV